METHGCNKAKERRKRTLWSPEEDRKLYNYITTFGVDSWSLLPQNAGLPRCAKSCRLRWVNHLDPNLKKCPISTEEEHHIVSLHNVFGNSWSKIAEHLPGRTDNEIKNFWYCQTKKRFRKSGALNANNKEPSSCSTNKQDTLHQTKYGNKIQTYEVDEKLEASLPCYNSTPSSSTSEVSYTTNGVRQQFETDNGIRNLGNQWSEITAEGVDSDTRLRDYMISLSMLLDQEEF